MKFLIAFLFSLSCFATTSGTTDLGSTISSGGGGGGSGTVTSVGLSLPAIFSVSGSPVTTSGTISATLGVQSAHTFWGGPLAGSVAPTFRLLSAADIPSLSYVSSVTASAPLLSSGGLTPNISMPLANTTTNGYLSSADWNTFNNKFTLPALTSGSVVFSDGATLAQDNPNLFWDNTNKFLSVGSTTWLSSQPKFQVFNNQTDPAFQETGMAVEADAHYTANNFGTLIGSFNILKPIVDATFSLAGGAIANNAVIGREDASDQGDVSIAASYFGQLVQGNAAKTTDEYDGFITGFHSVDNMGTVGKLYDFHAMPSSIPGGVVGNRYGIYLEPDSGYTKQNWLSGSAVIGGTTYTTPTTTLSVQGDVLAQKTVTDSGLSAGIFNATSNTTVNGSNTTIGINGVATGTVQAGAENDKTIGGVNFAITRGDGTDQGIMDAVNGANVLMFINSDAAGVTNNAFGFSSITFSQGGTLTNEYDFYGLRVPAGPGVVTNHYGVYIENDSTTQVKNWLSGHTQIGGSGFSLNSSAALDVQGTDGAILFPRMATADKNALTATAGMEVYDTDLAEFDCYSAGVWAACGSGSSGMLADMSNMASPTAMSQDLIWATTGSPHTLKTLAASGATNSDTIQFETGDVVDGAGGDLYFQTGFVSGIGVRGNIDLRAPNVNLGAGDGTSPATFSFYNVAGTQSVNLKAPDALAATWQFTLPPDTGALNQVMITDGAGVTSWSPTVQINTTGLQPTCDATTRGMLWLIEGGAGVADIFQICQKNAADVYLWTVH